MSCSSASTGLLYVGVCDRPLSFRSSCSPRWEEPSRGCVDSIPARTTTWSSRLPTRSCSPACALLRRAGPTDRLRFADLDLEPATRSAWRGSRPLMLTHTEFALLEHFLRHPRQVLTREQLLESVWAGEPEGDNVVAVYVGYVRQKLEEAGEPRLLHTVRGTGYALREG